MSVALHGFHPRLQGSFMNRKQHPYSAYRYWSPPGGVEVVKGGVRYTVVAKALIIGQGVYSCYSAVPRLQILSSDSKNIHISLKIDHFRCSQQLKQNRRPVGVLNNQPIWIFHLVTEHGRFLCPENSML